MSKSVRSWLLVQGSWFLPIEPRTPSPEPRHDGSPGSWFLGSSVLDQVLIQRSARLVRSYCPIRRPRRVSCVVLTRERAMQENGCPRRSRRISQWAAGSTLLLILTAGAVPQAHPSDD